jgi:predicted ATPase/DNA-binding CsgD family transcriptional regulator/tetratricopeptide (TPR) repeat protein
MDPAERNDQPAGWNPSAISRGWLPGDHAVPGGALSIRAAAAWIGVSERTLRRAIARGELEAFRVGGATYVRASVLADYRTQLSVPARALPSRKSSTSGEQSAPVALDTALHAPPPQPVTRLIGRAQELVAARDIFLHSGQRLLTLTGPGGVGKTRLALALAANVGDHFADGVVYVDLAQVPSPDLVGVAITRALGVREVGSRSVVHGIVTHLRHQELLLLLDNFEHLLPAAPIVAQMLASCPGLAVLVTSRAPLHLDGERLFEVPPLSLPGSCSSTGASAAIGQPCSVATVAAADAVTLFVERVRAVQAGFALTETNAPVVARICERLDGLPLAIELAAARCRVLSPQGLLSRLERTLPVLTDGHRGTDPRHASLAQAIAWSYELLSPAEQIAFRRLAVFAGGFTLEAAEQVATLDPASSLDLVAALHAQSLITRREITDGEIRFGMLETVPEFALEMLEASGESAAVRRRHAEYCLAAAAGARWVLPRPGNWWVTFEREWSNFASALGWAATSGEAVLGLQLGGELFGYWMLRGGIPEGITALERLLASAGNESATVRGRGATALGFLHWFSGNIERAQPLSAESLELAETQGDVAEIAVNLFLQGFLAEAAGDLSLAVRLLREARSRYQSMNAASGSAAVAGHLGRILWRQGQRHEGKALLKEAVDVLGLEPGGDWGADLAASDLAVITVADGYPAQAASLLARGLRHQAEIGDQFAVLLSLTAAARVICVYDAHEAARLLGAAASLSERAGPSLWAVARPIYEETTSLARSMVGSLRFEMAWDEGRLLRSEAAVSLALQVLEGMADGAPGRARQSTASRSDLTARELAVMRRVAAGLTDQVIAIVLIVRVRTVNAHVSNVKRKLGVSSRAAAAAEVTRLGIV